MVDRYAVIGNPVAHSRSPFIHTEFAREEGISIVYESLCAEKDNFVSVVNAFMETGGRGLNVTLPFKENAFRMATECTERACAAEAVNTITFRDGKVYGDNTDGVGLVRDIVKNLDVPITGKRVLILGAGGAARGIIVPLFAEHPAQLTIANRTLIKAEALVHRFSRWGVCNAVSYHKLVGERFDVVINATSSSLHNELPPIPVGLFSARTLAYDMVYGKGLTPFLRRAQSENAGMLADGVGMLVEQAAESWLIWRGTRPGTRRVTHKLRELLA